MTDIKNKSLIECIPLTYQNKGIEAHLTLTTAEKQALDIPKPHCNDQKLKLMQVPLSEMKMKMLLLAVHRPCLGWSTQGKVGNVTSHKSSVKLLICWYMTSKDLADEDQEIVVRSAMSLGMLQVIYVNVDMSKTN